MHDRCELSTRLMFDTRGDARTHRGIAHRDDELNARVDGKRGKILMDRNAIDDRWAGKFRIYEKSQTVNLQARTLLITQDPAALRAQALRHRRSQLVLSCATRRSAPGRHGAPVLRCGAAPMLPRTRVDQP